MSPKSSPKQSPGTKPDLVVVACNTASTLALAQLRARFTVPFVGTVPAIKPACAQSKSEARRRARHAGHRRPRIHARADPRIRRRLRRRVWSARRGLPALRKPNLPAQPVGDDAIAAEIAPCFVDAEGRRTDTIVLACTHYPLAARALSRRRAMAGRLARSGAGNRAPGGRVVTRSTLAARHCSAPVIEFTSGRTPSPTLRRALNSFGF